MQKEFDPAALNDEWYWKYVHGQKRPEDLGAWLQGQGLSTLEAERLALETELIKWEVDEGREKLRDIYGVTRGSFRGES